MSTILKFIGAYKYVFLIVLILGGAYLYTSHLKQQLDDTRISLSIASNNEAAYKAGVLKWEDRYGQEHAKTIMFNENLSNFKESQDSVTKKLISIIQEQGYSLDKLRTASLIQTKVSTSLTKEIQTKLPDTTVDLSNKNVKNIITLSPYRISSDIEFYNDQAILFRDSTYKVFIPYRKKFFISRWLQHKEKNTLVTVEVINSNPLMKTQQQKFIHIVKPD